ncbi:hypothetical protein [Enhygromyxa salina]|uniref:hypothetical protein n=1 Tax=Enhygromyxa salina TaxID=215803 RepID=UPI0011B1CE9C|nr:hypothetical protein [Enhygromyxa salina]
MTDEVGQLRGLVERDSQREDAQDLDFEQMVARDRYIAERRAAAITAAADREPVDMDWAPVTERQIAEGLADNGPPGARLISAVCMSTLCIVEIEHPPGDDGTGHVNWLSVFGLSRGFLMRHRPESGAGARTVAYLARSGHALPPAEPGRPGGRDKSSSFE